MEGVSDTDQDNPESSGMIFMEGGYFYKERGKDNNATQTGKKETKKWEAD